MQVGEPAEGAGQIHALGQRLVTAMALDIDDDPVQRSAPASSPLPARDGQRSKHDVLHPGSESARHRTEKFLDVFTGELYADLASVVVSVAGWIQRHSCNQTVAVTHDSLPRIQFSDPGGAHRGLVQQMSPPAQRGTRLR